MSKWKIGDLVWVRWGMGGEKEQATVIEITEQGFVMTRFTDGIEWPVYNHQLSRRRKET